MALLRIRKPDGEIVDIACLPGAKGADGYTPVKGVDYFTPAEQEAFLTSAKDYTDEKTAPATSEAYGTVKVYTDEYVASNASGIVMRDGGCLKIVPASEAAILGRSNSCAPIVPALLEFAIKSIGNGYYAKAEDVGDIETALDNIITIQESLIGGGISLISFTIDGTEYQAEEGMTWGEWIESEYNTDSWVLYEAFDHYVIFDGKYFVYDNLLGEIHSSHEIVANHDYGTIMK